jgi:NAD(P)-dependent dehydrogenase (short-subunit alcohol dehydrogenase family)
VNSIVSRAAGSGKIRVGVVGLGNWSESHGTACPAFVQHETAMLERLTGTAERKAAFLANVPLKRAGTPEEIADAIVFVASDKASFITGELIRINGGKTAS